MEVYVTRLRYPFVTRTAGSMMSICDRMIEPGSLRFAGGLHGGCHALDNRQCDP